MTRVPGLLVCAGLVVVLDFASGPEVQFPIAYVLPVLLAAWSVRKKWAMGLAVGLPLLRLGMVVHWGSEGLSLWAEVTNLLIRATVLLGLALVTLKYREMEREVKILRGLLPVCMYCKKIRDERQQWQPIEYYVRDHSEANFSHGMCPECARKHFPDIPLGPPQAVEHGADGLSEAE
ncbi:MAG: hypothetical protein IPL39_21860 [Opitutaceae bacterium]|nr:hypothetical protein [Opitutaceae bacterium]